MDTRVNNVVLNGSFYVVRVEKKFKPHTFYHLWKVKEGDKIEVFLNLTGNGMKYGGSSSQIVVSLNGEVKCMTVTMFLQALAKLEINVIN